MKVVVTGATGFVGSALCRALVREGYEVDALTRASSNRGNLGDLPIVWHTADVTDPASIRGAFEGADCVVHAAGMLGKTGVTDAAYHELHVEGTRNVIREAASASASRIVHVSSPGVLGPINGPPADETRTPAPSNPYERSKAAAEQVALSFAADGLHVVILRPEFIYGPGDMHVLGLFQTVKRGRFFYVGSSQYLCHPTYIDDATNGLLLGLQNGRAGNTYHIAGPRPVTFQELAETIALALDVSPPKLTLPEFAVRMGVSGAELIARMTGIQPPLSRTGVDFFSQNRSFLWNKARDELNYEPRVDLVSGIELTVSWYRERQLL